MNVTLPSEPPDGTVIEFYISELDNSAITITCPEPSGANVIGPVVRTRSGSSVLNSTWLTGTLGVGEANADGFTLSSSPGWAVNGFVVPVVEWWVCNDTQSFYERITSNTADTIVCTTANGTFADGDVWYIGRKIWNWSQEGDFSITKIGLIYNADVDYWNMYTIGDGLQGIPLSGNYKGNDFLDFSYDNLEVLLETLANTLNSSLNGPFIQRKTADFNIVGGNKVRVSFVNESSVVNATFTGPNTGYIHAILNTGTANVVIKVSATVTSTTLINGSGSTATNSAADITVPPNRWCICVREDLNDASADDATIGYVFTPFSDVTK